MVAADTSSLIAYFGGQAGRDVELVDEALQGKRLMLPPVVLTEILSDPKLPKAFLKAIMHIPILETTDGYWERAGITRSIILNGGKKARLADTLIAQACIDNEIPLVTRDEDFRHFTSLIPIRLLPKGASTEY